MIAELMTMAALALPHSDKGRDVPPSRTAVSRIEAAATILPARWVPFARCVSARESHNSYTARNPHSSAQGRWQFLDRLWRSPLAYMVAARLKDHGMPAPMARTIRITLQRTEIAAWPPRYQDIGFAAVITSGGAHHWALAGSICEAYR